VLSAQLAIPGPSELSAQAKLVGTDAPRAYEPPVDGDRITALGAWKNEIVTAPVVCAAVTTNVLAADPSTRFEPAPPPDPKPPPVPKTSPAPPPPPP
jgi:hypothetical protein